MVKPQRFYGVNLLQSSFPRLCRVEKKEIKRKWRFSSEWMNRIFCRAIAVSAHETLLQSDE